MFMDEVEVRVLDPNLLGGDRALNRPVGIKTSGPSHVNINKTKGKALKEVINTLEVTQSSLN